MLSGRERSNRKRFITFQFHSAQYKLNQSFPSRKWWHHQQQHLWMRENPVMILRKSCKNKEKIHRKASALPQSNSRDQIWSRTQWEKARILWNVIFKNIIQGEADMTESDPSPPPRAIYINKRKLGTIGDVTSGYFKIEIWQKKLKEREKHMEGLDKPVRIRAEGGCSGG